MAFVDDDEEEDVGPLSATNYYFEDDDKEPVSFARLPIQWNDKEKEDGSAAGFYLRGTSGDGLLTLHKLVKAWRFENRNFRPEVSVLTKDNVWIQLEKPRKSFIGLIGSVLITVYSLHYLRRNPQASEKSLWEHLSKFCKVYDVKPSMNDLVDHSDLIAQAVKRDPNLAKSKFILAFLAKTPTKQRLPEEDDSEDDFIVEDDTIVASDEEESDDEEDEVCAICDNGGNLVCCDGSCLRSFHATKKDGEDSVCESLNLTKTQVDAEKYYCPNCEHKIHQCFICKKLGSSDNSAETAEVFQCVSARCGYFYHPHCVTRRLRLNKAEAEALERQIIAGEYTCPLHKCCVCGNGEVKTDSSLQFALCRRCPKSYHRKCLPREISFEDIEEEDIFTRAWEGLLRNRVLIYCQEHEIDEELLTPVRDHVKFPFTEKKKVFLTQNRKILESHNGRDNVRPKFKDLASRDTCGKESVREFRSSFASSKNAVKKRGLVSSVPDHVRKRKAADLSRLSDLVPEKSQKMMKYGESCEAGKNKLEMNERREAGYNKVGVTEARRADKSKDSLGERSNMQQRNIIKPGRMVPVESRHKKTYSVASKEPGSEIPTLDSDSQRSLLKIIRKAKEEITMDTVLMKYKGQSTHTNSTKNYVEKTITMGRVEGSVQAIRTALKRLEEGGKTEDAKAVCEPETLIQIMKWKDKLKSYLTPFLHGARYTSYGRHFTNVKKLQQIVDRLHWYVEDGDMIVDFCCGANDFSCLMKKKLEETGKECSYKNYDLFDAKNDFNFERRDWMTVRKEELAKGSRLIMGLNPPFGVNAARANMFIAKALEFRPKILILIVPPETERLYNKKPPYVLIWEDEALLSGNSFYLPGSLSVENKQLDDWNKVTPPLSLWSRSDFAAKHKGIAEKQYHVSKDLGSSKFKQIEEDASDGVCDANSMQRDTIFENCANSGLKNEDAPVEKDELDVADCVNNILLSQKIEAWETPSVNHRSDYLSRRSQLENEERMEDYSGRMLKKPVDWKSNDMEEDRVEPNRGLDSTKVIPGMTSDWQDSVRSSDDIYAVCTPISNTSPQRSHVSVEASLPVIASTKNNSGKDVREPVGKDVREPDRKMARISKPEDTRNRPSSSRSSRENVYAVSRSSANMADMVQKPHETFEPSSGETFSHFDDGLAAKYCFGEGYGMPNPSYIPDQFPVAPAVRNCPSEISDYRGYSGFDRMGTMDYLPRYGSSNLDPMLAPPPPNLMDNSFPSQQQYAPHFDDYQTMNSFPPQPPMQPNRHSFYDPSGYPLPLPPPPPPSLGDFGIGSVRFAPGPNYPYNGPSGGWFND